jgi:hypothetical protein
MTSAQERSRPEEAAFRSRFLGWKQQFDGRTWRALEAEELFSTPWERLWDHAWAEYDELERIRNASGFARLTWQDGVEKDRRVADGIKKNKSKSTSLTVYDWTQVPLGLVIERYLGESICKGQSDVAIALGRWERFRKVIADDPGFERSLSFSQKVSWTILTCWWSAAYQDATLSNTAKASLNAASSPQAKVKYFFDEPHVDADKFAQVRKSVYNSTMYILFNREFNPYLWNTYFKEINLTTLRLTRLQAVKQAMAQRLAYTSYMKIRGLATQNAGLYTGSMDKPCPWLPKVRKEMPYYLWDIEQKRTVVVSGLGIEPEYCCVSHTWGRWRKTDIHIEGVPWLVPQNERFDVERLPEHLQQIRPRVPFVWIDLFCIPQDGSAKAEEEINRQAVIFQNASRCIAWINDVVGWTSTVKALDWLGISYLHAATCPGIYETDELLESLRDEATIPSELFTGETEIAEGEKLLLDKDHPRPVLAINGRKLAEPACWFSSLWTLQEAMLCPNMTFVDRHWTPLEDRSGISIPLDAFFNFIDTMENLWHDSTPYKVWTEGSVTTFSKYKISQQAGRNEYLQWPDGPRQLHEFCIATRMDNLVESPSSIGLLMVANVRQCTGSRAPAIMSAVGITDWYVPNQTKKNGKANLVLNCYPLSFVKEAAAKLGASFYESAKYGSKKPIHYNGLDRSQRGSMMPFSATSGWFSRVVATPVLNRYTPEDHPAVKTWSIRQDGSVDITLVGVVASSEESPNLNPYEDTPVTAHIMKPGFTNAPEVRFADLAKNIPKGVCMYAVSLLKDSQQQRGLLLEGCTRRKNFMFSSSTQRLVKVGTFSISNIDFPPSKKVNWVAW